MDEQQFWSDYQPGFRFAHAPVGSPEFFREVTSYRDRIEPHIGGVVDFPRWSGMKVLEAGCGIGTDGSRFAAAGADYTGLDFSPTALTLASGRFELECLTGRFVGGSLNQMPFRASTFDLVFSHGVIHHIEDTGAVIREFSRVLKPGGTALIMVYHRRSLNYHISIMVLRRALVATLLVPKASALVAKLTGEPVEVIAGHRALLTRHRTRYLRDRELFLSHNTDGPGNPLANVYTADELGSLLPAELETVRNEVRYLNLRLYPGGDRFTGTSLARRLERRIGWHLYVECRKQG